MTYADLHYFGYRPGGFVYRPWFKPTTKKPTTARPKRTTTPKIRFSPTRSTTNMRWETTAMYDKPLLNTPSTTAPDNTKELSICKILCFAFAVGVVFLLLGIVCWKIYKRYKRRQRLEEAMDLQTLSGVAKEERFQLRVCEESV